MNAFAGMIALCVIGWNYGGMGGLIGGAVMPYAHLFGAGAGLLLGLASLWRDRLRGRLGRPEAAGL